MSRASSILEQVVAKPSKPKHTYKLLRREPNPSTGYHQYVMQRSDGRTVRVPHKRYVAISRGGQMQAD